MGNLHGACSATLVDSVSSAAMSLLGTEGFWGPPMLSGVSVTLDMQYLNPAPVGAKVRLTCTVEHMTTSMANIRVDVSFAFGVGEEIGREWLRGKNDGAKPMLTRRIARRLEHKCALLERSARQDLAEHDPKGQALSRWATASWVDDRAFLLSCVRRVRRRARLTDTSSGLTLFD